MKIIEAMKQVKDLLRKAEDLRGKAAKHAADMTIHKPVYDNQHEIIAGWIQAHHDIMLEIERLRTAITRTNIQTDVTIEIGDKKITKPISAWIQRRKDLAAFDHKAWMMLGELERRGDVKEATIHAPGGTGEYNTEIHVRRYYDPKEGYQAMDVAWRSDEFMLEPQRITVHVGATGIEGDALRKLLIDRFDIQINKTSRNTVLFLLNIGTTRGAIAYLLEVPAPIVLLVAGLAGTFLFK